MSASNPYMSQNYASQPSLHLYPLDDSFVPKRIALGGGQRVKIARPPNTKTVPAERNGFFDSRVLSRQHAEVWEEGDRIFIKDVKSSNGTFINGERLSLEGRESEPFELKTDDILEFGVDIVAEDNKTVLHRKVVARVNCVFPNKTGQPPPPPPHDQFATMSPGASNTFNLSPSTRRPQVPMIHQGLSGLGGMGGGMRAPGRGLTLDHIFSRLQSELAKSRDTGHDLQVLTGTLGSIEDTLNNGAVPSTGLPTFPDVLPPVVPPVPLPVSLPQVPPLAPPPSADTIAELQTQLREHQAVLNAHVEGIRALEAVLAEQETMKREFSELREFVGVDRRAEVALDEEEEVQDDDNSDAQSVMTATPHELERVDEEDEHAADDAPVNAEPTPSSEQEDDDALWQEREDNLTRQRAQTPEPILANADDAESSPPPRILEGDDGGVLSLGELTARLALLTSHLESALSASSALQEQHSAAQTTINALEAKLTALEARVLVSESPDPVPEPVPAPEPAPEPSALPIPAASAVASADLEDMQTQLSALRAELATERAQREAWEERIRLWGTGVSHPNGNGHLEDEHQQSRVKRRRSVSANPGIDSEADDGSGSEGELRHEEESKALKTEAQVPLVDLPGLPALSGGDPSDEKPLLRVASPPSDAQLNVQAAIGVLILGIAAAAVLWRVKPQ